MRITLDIAEDVLYAARERAQREKEPVGAVISDWARSTLNRAAPPPAVAARARFGFRPFAKRGGVVTNELIDRLRKGDAY
jgi:hypothetical protein